MRSIDVTRPRVGTWLSQQFPYRVRLRALVIAIVLTLALALLMLTAGPLLGALDHWTADLRTAFFTYRLATQHPSVALVLIDEDAIAEAQKDSPVRYRSPIDRGLLTRTIEALDRVAARAIGFDIIVDQPSERAKDDALLRAVQDAKAPIVLARLDFAAGKSVATEAERAYHIDFLEKAGRASGYVTVKSEADGTVRTQPTPGSGELATFPEEIAKLGGWHRMELGLLALVKPSNRIAWLRPPQDNSTTFLTIPEQVLITPPEKLSALERDAVAELKDHLVIIGVKFLDSTDRHRTPLSKSGEEEMSGVEINAQVVAQLIDGRSYYELTMPAQLWLCFLTALVGTIAGWRFHGSAWLAGGWPLAVYVAANAALFWQTKFILPFAAPMLAWVVAVYAGQWLRRRDVDMNIVNSKEKQT